MRKPIIAGNWKMYETAASAVFLFQRMEDLLADVQDREIVVCPPFIALRGLSVIKEQDQPAIALGAQNMHWEVEGAYTGEVSPKMLKDLDVEFVILGHSERRHIFKETDEMINAKVHAALKHSLTPILCVGELLEERERGDTSQVIDTQMSGGLAGVENGDIKKIVIAYEPVWAIGTGKTATPETAQETVKSIRDLLVEMYDQDAADSIRILYGGSVKPDNIDTLMSEPDIDGALVGGASLDPQSFARIVKFKS